MTIKIQVPSDNPAAMTAILQRLTELKKEK